MLLAELQGIDVSYLHSLAQCAPGEPLTLAPRPDNPLLQFHTLREAHSGCEIHALHAGTPQGLMAYLFASWVVFITDITQYLRPIKECDVHSLYVEAPYKLSPIDHWSGLHNKDFLLKFFLWEHN